LNSVCCDFERRLVPIDLLEPRLGVIEDVDPLDDLARVFFEEEYEKLMFA
jgi:hypothetical protein